MAKKIFDFDYQGYFNEMFETTTVLMWSTQHAPFTFAFYLNKLYNFQLVRKDNITLKMPHSRRGTIDCTVFHHQSNVDHMAYLLIDSSGNVRDKTNNKKGTIFDKTLLLIGADSQELAKTIYDEMNEPATVSDNMLVQEREMTRREFIDSGILESVLFDFSNPDDMETTYFRNSLNDTSLEAKRQRFLNDQRNFVTDIMMTLDDLLPDFESDTNI
ncbi:MAG: hypothetical protein IJP80_01055 [Bacteroidales bacterium]|nr:hypothetical protein [Bacteroidales bacterium]